MIKKNFIKVIEHSQHFTPNVEDLFHYWKTNKAYFIEKFLQKEYIYEHPEVLTFPLSVEVKDTKVTEFARRVKEEYSTDLALFILDNKDSFFKNKLEKDYVTADYNIQAGIKLIKAYKFFIHDPKELREVQDEASQIIQSDTITGKLCFSVHPLDFLSLSQNNHKWRSCHSLNGDYRAGNLSYMADDCTIICYLKDDKPDEKLKGFPPDVPWNSKKWRMLLHCAKENGIIFAGRQYPFEIDGILETISKVFFKEINPYHYYEWRQGYITHCDDFRLSDKYYVNWEGFLVGLESSIVDCENALHYNDLLYSTIYTFPYYTGFPFTNYYDNEEKRVTTIGHEVLCLRCNDSYIRPEEGTMLCEDCMAEVYGQMHRCELCGLYHEADDFVMTRNGFLVCGKCAQNALRSCSQCGQIDFVENFKVTDAGEYICTDCANEEE